MLSEAIEYPRRGDDTVKTILVGGLLTLTSILVVPALFLQGYMMRVLRQGHEDAYPPAFDDWGGMFVDGLKALAISLVYGLVAAAVVFVVPAVVGTFVLSMGSGGGGAGVGIFAAIVALVLVPLLFALVLGSAYLAPAALALFAREGRVGAAFDLGTLRRIAFTGEYFVGFLLYLVVVVVGQFVGSLLMIALFLGVFVLFYAQLAGFYVIGRAVDDALAATA